MSIETDIKQKKFRSAYQRLSINLTYTSNWLGYKQLELFKEHDITSQQYNVLRILRGQQSNAIKVTDIAERMLDKNSNTSRLIDKLLVKGLAKRTSCPSDRRAVDVVITPEGLDLLSKVTNPKRHQFFVSDYTSGFEKSTQMFFGQKINTVQDFNNIVPEEWYDPDLTSDCMNMLLIAFILQVLAYLGLLYTNRRVSSF